MAQGETVITRRDNVDQRFLGSSQDAASSMSRNEVLVCFTQLKDGNIFVHRKSPWQRSRRRRIETLVRVVLVRVHLVVSYQEDAGEDDGAQEARWSLAGFPCIVLLLPLHPGLQEFFEEEEVAWRPRLELHELYKHGCHCKQREVALPPSTFEVGLIHSVVHHAAERRSMICSCSEVAVPGGARPPGPHGPQEAGILASGGVFITNRALACSCLHAVNRCACRAPLNCHGSIQVQVMLRTLQFRDFLDTVLRHTTPDARRR